MSSYYESTVLRVGSEAAEMIDGGVLILFADPVPEELEEVSIVHAPAASCEREMRPGDQLRMGSGRAEVIEVGDRATENLRTIGHFVVYLNPEDGSNLLPGAVHARGRLPAPKPGTRLAIDRLVDEHES